MLCEKAYYPNGTGENREHVYCSDENNLRISDKCCEKLKEEPLIDWQNKNKKSIAIIGLMRAEGGRRTKSTCLAFKGKKLKNIDSDSKGMELIGEREIDNWFATGKTSNIMADIVIDLKKEK